MKITPYNLYRWLEQQPRKRATRREITLELMKWGFRGTDDLLIAFVRQYGSDAWDGEYYLHPATMSRGTNESRYFC